MMTFGFGVPYSVSGLKSILVNHVIKYLFLIIGSSSSILQKCVFFTSYL